MTHDNEHDDIDLAKTGGFFREVRNYLITGIIVVLPIGVTVWIIWTFVSFIDGLIKPLIPAVWNPESYLNIPLPGVGVVIVVVTLIMLGALATNFLGRSLLRTGEFIFSRVPFVSSIYYTLKQIVTTVAAQRDRAFQDVCLVEYPRKDCFAIGFITSEVRGAPAKVLPPEHICVFVPTTPNPTSGFLLILPRADVKILDMTPEEGAKMIISGGMVTSNEELIDDEK